MSDSTESPLDAETLDALDVLAGLVRVYTDAYQTRFTEFMTEMSEALTKWEANRG